MWGRLATCAAVANRRCHCIQRNSLVGRASEGLPSQLVAGDCARATWPLNHMSYKWSRRAKNKSPATRKLPPGNRFIV
jgi:hypothetical protein